jgi:hypothetical protein
VKEKHTIGSIFFGTFPYYSVPNTTKESICISLFTSAISVNYTNEFRGHFEANTCVFILISHLCLHLPDCVPLSGFPFLIVSAVFILFNKKI